MASRHPIGDDDNDELTMVSSVVMDRHQINRKLPQTQLHCTFDIVRQIVLFTGALPRYHGISNSMHGWPCSVWPSVRLSFTGRYCIETSALIEP